MQEIIPDIKLWLEDGEEIALATVIKTWGSSPRGAGAKMALSASGKMTGSVSGGCVEGAVIEAGIKVIGTGQAQLLDFGVADEKAWEVGLACGGAIEVFVQPLDIAMLDAIQDPTEKPIATITIVRGHIEHLGRQMLLRKSGDTVGTLGYRLDELAVKAALGATEERRSKRIEICYPDHAISFTREEGEQQVTMPAPGLREEPDAWADVFIEDATPPPTLVIVGGVHIAVALTNIAKTLGFHTVVVDPRRAFGSDERFPNLDQVLLTWPDKALTQIGLDSSTAVAVLTHDPKLDDPALQVALPSQAFYVGALGSRATNAKRRERLLQAGMGAEQLDRLNSPIGLNLGGQSPAEIALAVMAQIVAARHGLQGVEK